MHRRAVMIVAAALLAGCTSSTGGHGTVSGTPSAPGHGLRNGSFQARPLVAPAVAVRHGTTPVPLTGLGFALPQDEAHYDALPAAGRTRLATALAGTDCTRAPVAGTTVAACGRVDGAELAMLTGPAILTARDVADAQAVPPSAATGNVQWSVRIDLTASGRSAFAAWTTAHNAGGQATAATPLQCASTGTPCADYVAFLVSGSVVSVPVSIAAIPNGSVQISGTFGHAGAVSLAREIAS